MQNRLREDVMTEVI